MAIEDQGPLTNTLVWVFTTVAILFVLSRLICRLKIKPNAGWDDLAITVSLAVDIAFSITISVAVSKGTGRHSDTLPSHEAAIQVGYWNTIATELAIFSFGLPKVAIALLLGRILNVRPALCWLLYSLAGVLVVFAVIEDIVFIEQCSPINAMWDKSVPATCWDPSPIAVSGVIYGVFSSFLDFFYAILPVTIISQLRMDVRRKIGLGIMMGLGVIAGVVGICKCTQLFAFASPEADYVWVTAKVLYWSSIEANCVIVAACVPTLSPITQLVASKAKALTNSSSYYPSGGRSRSSRRTCAPDGLDISLQNLHSLSRSNTNFSTRNNSWDDLISTGSDRRFQLRRNEDGRLQVEEVESGTCTPMTMAPDEDGFQDNTQSGFEFVEVAKGRGCGR